MGLCATTAFAEPSGKFAITPYIGVASEGSFTDGAVVFADGDVDFILVEPGTAAMIGLELGYRFSPKLEGMLGISYAMADARYIEDNDLRRDVDFDTLRIQPALVTRIVDSGAVGVDVGGGLTLARISMDGLVWNDRALSPSTTAIGLFGTAGLDIEITPRLAFHTHLMLELSRPFFGGFEDDLARADGEASAELDRESRLGLLFAVGLRIAL